MNTQAENSVSKISKINSKISKNLKKPQKISKSTNENDPSSGDQRQNIF